LKGNLTLSPLASEGTVALAKVLLKKYAPYYGDAVRFDINGGTLDVRSGYRFTGGRAGIPAHRPGAALSDLRSVSRKREEFLKIPDSP